MHISNLMHLPYLLWRTLSDAFIVKEKKKKASLADMKSKWRSFHKNYKVSSWPPFLWWGLLKRCHVPALRAVNTHQNLQRGGKSLAVARTHLVSRTNSAFIYFFLKHGAVTAPCDGMSNFSLSLPKLGAIARWCVSVQEALGSHWKNLWRRPFLPAVHMEGRIIIFSLCLLTFRCLTTVLIFPMSLLLSHYDRLLC